MVIMMMALQYGRYSFTFNVDGDKSDDYCLDGDLDTDHDRNCYRDVYFVDHVKNDVAVYRHSIFKKNEGVLYC